MAEELGAGLPSKDAVRATIGYGQACVLRASLVNDPEDKRRLAVGARDPLACYRLAGMIERGEAEGGLAVAAQLYADACLTPTNEYPSVTGAACTRAAEIHFRHGWEYKPRAELGGFNINLYPDVADAFDFSSRGCLSGALGSCAILKTIYEEREAKGTWFDLRDD